jgi:hypothetical protein
MKISLSAKNAWEVSRHQSLALEQRATTKKRRSDKKSAEYGLRGTEKRRRGFVGYRQNENGCCRCPQFHLGNDGCRSVRGNRGLRHWRWSGRRDLAAVWILWCALNCREWRDGLVSHHGATPTMFRCARSTAPAARQGCSRTRQQPEQQKYSDEFGSDAHN